MDKVAYCLGKLIYRTFLCQQLILSEFFYLKVNIFTVIIVIYSITCQSKG